MGTFHVDRASVAGFHQKKSGGADPSVENRSTLTHRGDEDPVHVSPRMICSGAAAAGGGGVAGGAEGGTTGTP